MSRFSKVGEAEKVKQILDSYIPFDTHEKVSALEYVVEQVDEGKNRLLVSKRTNKTYQLNEHSTGQLIRLMDSRANPDVLKSLNSGTEETVVNELMRNRQSSYYKKHRYGTGENLLIRSKNDDTNTKSIAVLSEMYSPVNHNQIFNLIENTMQRTQEPIELIADYELAVARIPVKQISDHGLGTYFGIQFLNGQVGSHKLNIASMIWEKICTNGAVRTSEHDVFINKVHKGSLSYEMQKFGEWGNNNFRKLTEIFPKLVTTNIPQLKEYIEHLPKESALITKGLAAELYQFVIRFDNKAYTSNTTSLWAVTRGITQLSQNFAIERRLELDSFAVSIQKKFGVN